MLFRNASAQPRHSLTLGKLSGKFEPCSDCAKAKAKQANVPKSIPDEKRSTVPGERLFFDISSIKSKSFGGAKFWLLIVDDATGFAFSYFLKKKSETAGKIFANPSLH